jgi:hypothetical protein
VAGLGRNPEGRVSDEARELISRFAPDFPMRHCGRVVTDTTQFMDIDYGDVVAVGGRHYLVSRHESERKFGLEDPKYWVKRCRDLETGEAVILKLVFRESFSELIGSVQVMSYRSETKEARILDLVRGDTRFMQGLSAPDDKGNLVRVLEIIRGRRLDDILGRIELDHRAYFNSLFPEMLEKFLGSCEAIGFLHAHGEKHGDIRSDHIWVETGTGQWRWIDFDYTFEFHESPFGLDLFGLGNILLLLAGKGVPTLNDIAGAFPPEIVASLVPEDFSIVLKSRVFNLRKLYPYVPERLNNVLLRFSQGSEVFYESVGELLEDLRPCLELVRAGAGG